MIINMKPIYKRIILKLSGEVLHGPEKFGIDANTLDRIASEIKEIVELGVQVGIVIGGGNLFRGYSLITAGINRITGDYIGMMATVINGLAIYDALQRINVNASLMSTFSIDNICDSYHWEKAIDLLYNNHVVIFCGGTGNPCFTTDSAACLRGIEIKADIILKGTKVDGVFTSDPVKNFSVIMYDKLSYNEVLKKELKIMDLVAFILARDHQLPICIFNINKPGVLRRIILGEKKGTLIT